MATYGTDETSRAVIQFYFKRNKKAKLNVIIFSSAGLLAVPAFDRIIMHSSPTGDGNVLGTLAIGIPLGSLIYVSAVTVAINIYY